VESIQVHNAVQQVTLKCRIIVSERVVARGAEYEFRLSAKNLVDYGATTIEALRTPDGSE